MTVYFNLPQLKDLVSADVSGGSGGKAGWSGMGAGCSGMGFSGWNGRSGKVTFIQLTQENP